MKAATEYRNGKYVTAKISIHAAREGGDHENRQIRCVVNISIHAAREGGDLLPFEEIALSENFNPRRP